MLETVPLQREDRQFLTALPPVPRTFRAFGRPAKVSAEDWHRRENQGPIGSCRGNSGTSSLEKIAFVQRRERVQLSRMFFYLATQKLDGLLGSDRGSTISGGFKLMQSVGCPREDLTGYPSRYPGSAERTRILAQSHYDAGEPYKAAHVWAAPDDYDGCADLIACGAALDFGIRWYSGLIPRDRIVRSFRPPLRSGGHAMCILGYDDERGMLEAWNSHGDGLYWITPEAWAQMMRDSYTAAGAVAGAEDPKPEWVDWIKESYL